MISEVLFDSSGDGFADQRQVYRDGAVVRTDADTNADRKPDVVQSASNGIPIQDEDVDYDGVVDQRFKGDQLVSVPAGTAIAGAAFQRLDCGSFHPFWWRRGDGP